MLVILNKLGDSKMYVKISKKGQLTVPKFIRERLNIESDMRNIVIILE